MLQKKINDIYSSIAIYYKKSTGTYWDRITECNVYVKPEKVDKYYLNFGVKVQYPGEFDTNGVPLYNNTYQPVVICQYALGLYEQMMTDKVLNQTFSRKFLAQANWLVRTYSEINGGAAWLFNYDIAGYNLKAPWCSAMAQGEAISVLLRAYKITGDDKYKITAEKALLLFEYEVQDKGIISYFNNHIIFEEYPSSKPNVVLNGMIFALFGLYDFSLYGNERAKALYIKGIKSVEYILPLFDTGYWSQYNLYSYPKKYLASYRYHIIHIEQLKALAVITGNNIFKHYSDKWEGYSNSFYTKTYALIRKILNNNRVAE